jgi:hypothetical protein
MADSLPTDGERAVDDASAGDRDAKIERLLVAGLDHYFAQRYEQAIAVWTRTLFFDRTHPRARAYIERARSALAERQRQSEELLHRGAAALARGQDDDARRLLQAAVERGAPSDDVRPLLDRLQVQVGSHPAVDAAPLSVDTSRSSASDTALGTDSDEKVRSRVRSAWRLAAVVAVGVVSALVMANQRGWDVRAMWSGPEPAAAFNFAPVSPERPLPAPRRGEIALGRARALVAGGHLREALVALDAVRTTDPEKAEADRIRADIQRRLVSAAGQQR